MAAISTKMEESFSTMKSSSVTLDVFPATLRTPENALNAKISFSLILESAKGVCPAARNALMLTPAIIADPEHGIMLESVQSAALDARNAPIVLSVTNASEDSLMSVEFAREAVELAVSDVMKPTAHSAMNVDQDSPSLKTISVTNVQGTVVVPATLKM